MKLQRSAPWLLLFLGIFCFGTRHAAGQENPLRLEWKVREGKDYVRSQSLKGAGIEFKNLPGEPRLALCTSNSCVLVSDFLREDETLWIARSELETAGVKFTELNGKWQVNILPVKPGETGTRVGAFAPAIQFELLDGRRVRLADFTGKRVLINNWASW